MVRFARAIKNFAARIWSKSKFWTWPAIIRERDATIATLQSEQSGYKTATESALVKLSEVEATAQDALAQAAASDRASEEFKRVAERSEGLLDETNRSLRATALERDRLSEALSRSEQTNQSLETDLLRANLTIEKLEAELAHVKLDREAEKANHDSTRAGLIKLLEWIHATHRLSAPPQGVRKVLQSMGRFSR